jgi:hypothetical protein
MQQSKNQKSKDVRLFRQPASQPMHASVIFMGALHNFVPKEKKKGRRPGGITNNNKTDLSAIFQRES